MELKDTKAYKGGKYSFNLYGSIIGFSEEEIENIIQNVQDILNFLRPKIIGKTDISNCIISGPNCTVKYNTLSKEEKRVLGLYWEPEITEVLKSYQELRLDLKLFSDSIIKLKKEVLYIAWQVFPRLYKARKQFPSGKLEIKTEPIPQPKKRYDVLIKKKTVELIALWEKLLLQVIRLQFFGIKFDTDLQIIYPNQNDIFPVAIQFGQDTRLIRFLYSVPGDLHSEDIRKLSPLHTELKERYYANITDTFKDFQKGNRYIMVSTGIPKLPYGILTDWAKKRESKREKYWKYYLAYKEKHPKLSTRSISQRIAMDLFNVNTKKGPSEETIRHIIITIKKKLSS